MPSVILAHVPRSLPGPASPSRSMAWSICPAWAPCCAPPLPYPAHPAHQPHFCSIFSLYSSLAPSASTATAQSVTSPDWRLSLLPLSIPVSRRHPVFYVVNPLKALQRGKPAALPRPQAQCGTWLVCFPLIFHLCLLTWCHPVSLTFPCPTWARLPRPVMQLLWIPTCWSWPSGVRLGLPSQRPAS